MEVNDYNKFIGMSPVKDGRPTERTIAGVKKTMESYLDSVGQLSRLTRKNSNSYRVKEIYLVGSGVCGKADSDLDLVLVAPKVSFDDACKLKLDLATKLFCNRDKKDALDIFVGNVDKSKPAINLTPYVTDLLKKYNPVSNKRN